ncbi:glycosyltransferase involved in cell wall biosynthesis [Novosphingobium chloroacetimidivorans]|uniref:Glycosyltransferase involved in cell wall biosynthesis n=1 Tax=Novosphingobium chloroacetimidivorans TaxID=1428314 RepID=A0A7W7K749_9SPHN|nr:glycosyltransferase [Novosphingobium chloroacetimidivorans]MBB4856959.1 glycosyltransferase involved in cell wall biosynthesis [Novosphingobium chloroacetimidivorans]
MKIAIYVQDMRASGVVRTMIALAQRLAATDEVVLLAGHASGLFGAADVVPARFVAARAEAQGRLPRLTVVPDLRLALRELNPDVVLSGGNFGHFSIWAATLGLRLPVVYVFSNAMERQGQPWRTRWRRFWSSLLVRGAGGAILVGANLVRSKVFASHVASGRAAFVPNGIDLSAVPQPTGAAPEPMRGAEPVVLSIGRLQPQKGFESLIAAIATVRRQRPVRLVVLGTGSTSYREALLAHAEALGVREHVLFAGTTDDVYPWLRAAHVFALASRWEGSSIALLEAMAANTPVVASVTAGDAAQVLEHGRHGVLVDPEDAEAFAAALLRQIDDPVRPGARVRDYDLPLMVRAYHDVLIQALARAKGAREPTRSAAGTRPSR